MARKNREEAYVPRAVETNIQKDDTVRLKTGHTGEVEKQELQCFFKLRGEKIAYRWYRVSELDLG